MKRDTRLHDCYDDRINHHIADNLLKSLMQYTRLQQRPRGVLVDVVFVSVMIFMKKALTAKKPNFVIKLLVFHEANDVCKVNWCSIMEPLCLVHF